MRTFQMWIPLVALAAGCAHNCPTAPAAVPTVPAPAPAMKTADDGASPPVAKIGDRVITLAEVDKAAGHELFELRESTLDKLISEEVVEAAAKKAGKPVDQFLEERVKARVPEVSEAEAKDFFTKNKDRLPEGMSDKKFAEVKDVIVRGLTEQKRREALSGMVEELKTQAGVKILIAAPKIEVAATGPAKGPASAKVTIVEFSDFQCPFCARGKQVMDQVVAAYGADVRLVFRDFPLSFHEKAQKAAEAGHCADEQGKFWAMHDWMFDNQQQLDVDHLKGAAKTLGLDVPRFDRCVDSGKYAGAVADNQRAGEQAGVRGTPAFFVNGAVLSGAQPFEKFKSEIDRALGR